MKTVASLAALVLSFTLLGCTDIARPQSYMEAFPDRGSDPRVGVIVVEGTAPFTIKIFDEADRLVEESYVEGANRFFRINGRHIARHWVRVFEPGYYRVEIEPFYYRTSLVPPGRFRVDLFRFHSSIYVPKAGVNRHYGGRYWGWTLVIHQGDIPETAHGFPGVTFEVN